MVNTKQSLKSVFPPDLKFCFLPIYGDLLELMGLGCTPKILHELELIDLGDISECCYGDLLELIYIYTRTYIHSSWGSS